MGVPDEHLASMPYGKVTMLCGTVRSPTTLDANRFEGSRKAIVNLAYTLTAKRAIVSGLTRPVAVVAF